MYRSIIFLSLLLALPSVLLAINDKLKKPLSVETEPIPIIEWQESELKGASQEEIQILESLKHLIKKNIYTYKNTQILPPDSFLQEAPFYISTNILYQTPEIRSRTEKSELRGKQFNKTQLSSILEHGTFIVKSSLYPELNYVYKVRLIAGGDQISLKFKNTVQKGLKELIVKIPRRLITPKALDYNPTEAHGVERPNGLPLKGRDKISIENGLAQIFLSIKNTLGLIIGAADKQPRYTQAEVESIMLRELSHYTFDEMGRQFTASSEAFFKKNGFVPDLRLYDPAISIKIGPILHQLANENSAYWEKNEEQEKNKLLYKYVQQELLEAVIQQKIENEITEEKQTRLYKLIKASTIDTIESGLSKLLIDNAEATRIVFYAEKKLNNQMIKEYKHVLDERDQRFPIKSAEPARLEYQTLKVIFPIYVKKLKKLKSDLVAELTSKGLIQDAYLFEKNIDFYIKEQNKYLSQFNVDEPFFKNNIKNSLLNTKARITNSISNIKNSYTHLAKAKHPISDIKKL